MIDEGKEFRWLEVMINSMEEVHGNHYAYYMKKGDVDKLKQLYSQLIQQKPKIDDAWVEEKAEEAMRDLNYWKALIPQAAHRKIRDFITQIIREVQG